MYPVVGIFTTRTDAERTGDHLQALGIPKEHISLLSPCAPEEEMALAPMMDTERPLMGKVHGMAAQRAPAAGGHGGLYIPKPLPFHPTGHGHLEFDSLMAGQANLVG